MAIPYMGSKSRLAVRILNVIIGRHPYYKNFYDLFGGGGSVSFKALGYFTNVYYNEIEASMVELIRELQTTGFNTDWWQPITRDEFKKSLDLTTSKAGIIKTCWSFGNNKNTYLYGRDIELLKIAAHDFIVNNTEDKRVIFNTISGLDMPLFNKNTSFYERRMSIKNAVKKESSLNPLLYLESLQRLEKIHDLQNLTINTLKLSNVSYEQVPIDANSIVYCDIPYKRTATYKGGDAFNYERFYKWALSLDQPVYISEYNMPSDFTEVAQFSHRSTLSATNNAKKTVERLYWNGKGTVFKNTLF